MGKYWFATQDPKVLQYHLGGLWVLDRFKNSHVNIDLKVGDWVAVYEPQRDRDRTRSDGAKAVVALSNISKINSPWKLEGDFWKLATAEIKYEDPKGIPAAIVVRILTGRRNIKGRGTGWYLNRLYAGRITQISRSQFNAIAKYFSPDDIDELYQEEVERTAPIQDPPKVPMEPQYENVQGQQKLVTNPALAKYCKIVSNFSCEFNPNHISFISKSTGKNFVEVHHLIRLKAQPSFAKALDNTANIVSLCPNCHRLLHHATQTEKVNHLKILLDTTRISKLNTLGTPITMKRLLQYY